MCCASLILSARLSFLIFLLLSLAFPLGVDLLVDFSNFLCLCYFCVSDCCFVICFACYIFARAATILLVLLSLLDFIFVFRVI